MYRCSVILNEKYRFIHTQNKWERLSLALIKTPLQYWYLCTVQTQGIRNTEQFSFAMHNLKGTKMGALFFIFSPSALRLCRFCWFMEPTESVLAPLISFRFTNLWLWIRNNGSSDHRLNTPFLLLLESKAVGQNENSCPSLVVSSSSNGELESKHQIGKKWGQ